MTDIVERLNNLLEADPDPAMCELYATCKAEIARLRAFVGWVEDHSNDPGIVLRAAALKDTKPDIVECAKCGAPVKYGSCCNECDEPSDH